MKADSSLKGIGAEVAARAKVHEHWAGEALETSGQLQLENDPMCAAKFLAQVCDSQDEKYGLGSQLCLEWMLEQYMALEFERAYPWIQQIHKFLVDGEHSIRNKFEYFNDSEAYFIDHPQMVMVWGKTYQDEPRFLLMDRISPKGTDPYYARQRFWVRQIWRQTRKKHGFIQQPTLKHYREKGFDLGYKEGDNRKLDLLTTYGDFRDVGHVLSYERMTGRKSCEGAISFLPRSVEFFFEVNTLWCQTTPNQ